MKLRGAKRYILLPPALLLLAALVCGASFALIGTDETVTQALSPDGQFVAEVSRSRWSSSAYVRVRDLRDVDWLGRVREKTLLASEVPIRVNMQWRDEGTLVIQYQHYKVYGVDDKPWHGLNFVIN